MNDEQARIVTEILEADSTLEKILIYKSGDMDGIQILLFDEGKSDIRKDNYNPFAGVSESLSLEDDVRQIEIAYASEAAKAFEALPVLDNADIIRNIIYSGIWSGFNKVCSRRHGTGSEERK